MRALLALATLLTAGSLPAATAVNGQSAPDFALKSAGGRNVRLSELRGEVVVLTFWADWCGRCADQLRDLDALQARYATDGVRVVAVNIDTDSRAARDAAARLDIMILHDQDQEVARQYQLGDLPLTVLVDRHGTVRHVHSRYRAQDAAAWAAEVSGIVAESAPTPSSPD